MLKRISKVLLLMALLSVFLTSRGTAFGKSSTSPSCQCYNPCFYYPNRGCKKPTGTCKLDTSIPGSFQCVSQNCSTYCVEIVQ